MEMDILDASMEMAVLTSAVLPFFVGVLFFLVSVLLFSIFFSLDENLDIVASRIHAETW